MASGLVCLVSIADGAHEFIDDGKTGFLLDPPASPPALAATLRRALALSPLQRASMGAAARSVTLPLTWEAHLDRWETLFHRFRRPRAPR